MKILITGGHVTPAIAVIDELKNQEVVFVGRKYASKKETKPSFEYNEITKRGIKFIDLRTGRLTRLLSFQIIFNLLKIILGFIRSFRIVSQEKPDRILSFGGYLALPVAFSGWLKRIPVYTHEQTISPGLGNKLISKFAKKVFVSFPEAAQNFKSYKVTVTGNPVRKNIFAVLAKPFNLRSDLKTMFISGGSLGSHSINQHLKNILPILLKKYQVIHQTGGVGGEHDYQSLINFKNQLPEDQKRRYFVKEHFYENEFGYVYSVSDLVVGRAGANTFFELVALEKPAVFIPLPWSSAGEQQKQAEIFSKNECGEVFDQNQRSTELLEKIEKVMADLDNYKNNFKNLKNLNPENAATTIAQEITTS